MPHLFVGFYLEAVKRNLARLCSMANWFFGAHFKIDACLNSLHCFENGIICNLFSGLVTKCQAP